MEPRNDTSPFARPSFLRHAIDLTAGHLLASAAMTAGASLIAWLSGITQLYLLAVVAGVGALVGALGTAIISYRRSPDIRQRRVESFWSALIVRWALSPVRAQSRHVGEPWADTWRVISPLTREVSRMDFDAIRRALQQLARQLAWRHNDDAQIRIEVMLYDCVSRTLRIFTAHFVVGWLLDLTQREYEISGHSPSGGASAAGEVWKEKRPMVIEDASTCGFFKHFGDAADRLYAPISSLALVPLLRLDARDGPPLGVMTIGSPRPHEMGNEDIHAAMPYALALSIHLNRSVRRAA